MTNPEPVEYVDQIDQTILQAVDDGHTDTLQIREATTLENRQINIHLVEKQNSLEDLGLVDITRPDGPERRTVNGHTQYLPHAPKRLTLTQKGRAVLQAADETKKYHALTHEELIRKVREHEDRIEELETRVDVLARQFRDAQRQ